jgi:hypothetical protein
MAENSQQSMRQLSRHHSIDPRTLRNLVKEDLGMESCVIVQRPHNEEGEVPQTPQQDEGQPVSSGLDFFQLKRSSPGTWLSTVAT